MSRTYSTHRTATGKQVLTIQDAQKQAKEMKGFRKKLVNLKRQLVHFFKQLECMIKTASSRKNISKDVFDYVCFFT